MPDGYAQGVIRDDAGIDKKGRHYAYIENDIEGEIHTDYKITEKEYPDVAKLKKGDVVRFKPLEDDSDYRQIKYIAKEVSLRHK